MFFFAEKNTAVSFAKKYPDTRCLCVAQNHTFTGLTVDVLKKTQENNHCCQLLPPSVTFDNMTGCGLYEHAYLNLHGNRNAMAVYFDRSNFTFTGRTDIVFGSLLLSLIQQLLVVQSVGSQSTHFDI